MQGSFTVNCPRCGEAISETAKFCPKCGLSLTPINRSNDVDNSFHTPIPVNTSMNTTTWNGQAFNQPQKKCKKCGQMIPAQAKVCPYCNKKQNSKIGLIAGILAVLVVIGAIGSGGSNTPSSVQSKPSSNNTTSQPQSNTNDTSANEESDDPLDSIEWISSGTYAVGTDIDAGEYFVVADRGSVYIEVNKDTNGTFDSIVSNESSSGFLYATVLDGQYFKVSGGSFIPIELKESLELKPTVFEDGMYKVGVDIEPGEYLIENTSSSCYTEVCKDSFNTFNSIVSNENIITRHYFTVEEGQYLKIDNGVLTPLDSVTPIGTQDEYDQGMYKVGFDIPAGTYLVTSNDSNCYIEINANSYNTFDGIITNDNIGLTESEYLTVSEGQYLYISGGTFKPSE